jgi:hypothetical protein
MRHASTGGDSYAVYQDVPVVAGAAYDLNVSVLVDKNLGFGKATLEVQSLGAWGGVLDATTVAAWQNTTDGWTRVGGTVRTGRDAIKARILIRVAALRGSFNLDDFHFQRSAT